MKQRSETQPFTRCCWELWGGFDLLGPGRERYVARMFLNVLLPNTLELRRSQERIDPICSKIESICRWLI